MKYKPQAAGLPVLALVPGVSFTFDFNY